MDGGASAVLLVTNNNNNNKNSNKNCFLELEKQKISKEEVAEMTSAVRRSNRPVNPYAEPKAPSPAPAAPPSSHRPQTATNGVGNHHLGVGVNDNGSSSAYSSYSSVGDSTVPAVFSASRAVPSPHEKTPTMENSAVRPAQSPSTKRQFSGFAAAAPNYHSNGFDSTRSTPARAGFLSPTAVPYVGARSASHAPDSALFSPVRCILVYLFLCIHFHPLYRSVRFIRTTTTITTNTFGAAINGQ
jgi:hypothetical protein